MTDDRKSELSRMCRLEIRRTVTLIRMGINDGDKEVAEVLDMEFWSMLTRIREKQVGEADLPLLRELVETSLGLDELDRGESVHIDEVLDKARAIVADAEHRKRQSAISRQIEADIEKTGRKAELLIEFRDNIETAVIAAMSVADDDVDLWLRTEVGRWQGVQLPSDDDRGFLLRYLRSLAIDEVGRRQRRVDGSESLKSFLAEHPSLKDEAETLVGRERELLDAYAGDLADSARGRVVKEEFLDRYARDEVALWPDVLELSDDDRDWLRRMIDVEYERIEVKQAVERNKE